MATKKPPCQSTLSLFQRCTSRRISRHVNQPFRCFNAALHDSASGWPRRNDSGQPLPVCASHLRTTPRKKESTVPERKGEGAGPGGGGGGGGGGRGEEGARGVTTLPEALLASSLVDSFRQQQQRSSMFIQHAYPRQHINNVNIEVISNNNNNNIGGGKVRGRETTSAILTLPKLSILPLPSPPPPPPHTHTHTVCIHAHRERRIMLFVNISYLTQWNSSFNI